MTAENTVKTSLEQSKKDWAKYLFTCEHEDPKRIAEKTGIAEHTITNWAEEEKWIILRGALLVTRQEQIGTMYKIVNALLAKGENAVINNDPRSSLDTNSITKLIAVITKLQTETTLGDVSSTLKDLVKFVLEKDFAAGQFLNDWAELFFNHRTALVEGRIV